MVLRVSKMGLSVRVRRKGFRGDLGVSSGWRIYGGDEGFCEVDGGFAGGW